MNASRADLAVQDAAVRKFMTANDASRFFCQPIIERANQLAINHPTEFTADDAAAMARNNTLAALRSLHDEHPMRELYRELRNAEASVDLITRSEPTMSYFGGGRWLVSVDGKIVGSMLNTISNSWVAYKLDPNGTTTVDGNTFSRTTINGYSEHANPQRAMAAAAEPIA